MKLSALSALLLLKSAFCVFSAIPHEITYVVGCFENGTVEVQFELDSEELLYVDFERQEVIYTVPRFVLADPRGIFEDLNVYRNAGKGKNACVALLNLVKVEEKNPPEEKDPPETVLYPSEEIQLGVENSLVCFMNHFYPPAVKVSWTKNDEPVSEGVSLSRYYPNADQTFHQFSTLTFTPREGDIYSCTVEHIALERPLTRIWESDIGHPSLGPDIFCGVGLALGLLGVAVGTFLLVQNHSQQ